MNLWMAFRTLFWRDSGSTAWWWVPFLEKTGKELLMKFPNCKRWLQWWIQPGVSSMTFRCKSLMKDELGERRTQAYRARLIEIINMWIAFWGNAKFIRHQACQRWSQPWYPHPQLHSSREEWVKQADLLNSKWIFIHYWLSQPFIKN